MLAPALALLGFGVYAFYFFGGMFLLEEYRQWTNGPMFNPLVIFNPATFFTIHGTGIPQGRTFSYFAVRLVSDACGHTAACHNFVQISLLLAAAIFTLATLRIVLGRWDPWACTAALVYMLFGMPVLDALSWQATTLDKFALFWSALTVLVCAAMPLRARLQNIAAFNLILLLLVFIADNSKQSALALGPSLVLLVAARTWQESDDQTVRALLGALGKGLQFCALALAYSVFHVILTYVALKIHPQAQAHNIGGNLASNVHSYVLAFTNATTGGGSVVWFFAAAFLASGVLCWRLAPKLFAFWAWAAISFLLSLSVMLQTAYASAFYLLVPAFYLSIVLFVALAALGAGSMALPYRVGMRAVMVVLAALYLTGLHAAFGPSAHEIRASKNFVGVLNLVKARLAQATTPVHLTFYAPSTEYVAYKFLSSENQRNRAIAPYIVAPGVPLKDALAYDRTITVKYYVDEPKLTKERGELSVLLGPELELLAIDGP